MSLNKCNRIQVMQVLIADESLVEGTLSIRGLPI